MALSITKEFMFVAACSAWPPSDHRTEAVREAAAALVDWDHILRLVIRHRIAGLVHDGLTRAQLVIPLDIAREIGRQAATVVRQNLVFTAESVRLQRMFVKTGPSVAFMKGTPLALVAYGNLGLRHSRDIDLLVSPESMPAAASLLERAGYQRYEPPASFSEAQLQTWLHRSKELRYVHEDKGIEIELHSRMFDNPQLMAVMPIPGRLRTVPISEEIGLFTFHEDDLFAYLCAHGAVHCWFRLKWLADIGALLSRQPEGGIERLYHTANAWGAGRSAAQAILLCQRLLGMTLPNQLVTTLSKRASVRWLEAIALKAITADSDPTELPFGTTLNNFSHFLLAREWRYLVAELENHLISPVDILMFPLPMQLRCLYPVLRLPLWLWRHRMRYPRPPQ